jgi:hypothetical protein
MNQWILISIIVLSFIGGFAIHTMIQPKVVDIQHDTTFVNHIDTLTITIEKVKVKSVAVLDTVWIEMKPFITATLDTIIHHFDIDQRLPLSDTLHVDYKLPPLNQFNVLLGLQPRPIVVQYRDVEVLKTVTVEKGQFLGGYPEKLLFFVAGFGTAKLVTK